MAVSKLLYLSEPQLLQCKVIPNTYLCQEL